MLELVQSNRLEVLADQLIDRLATAPPALFAREPIVVPSSVLGRWLNLRLAHSRVGIAAGLHMPFAAAYVWSLFATVLTDLPQCSPFDARILRWRLTRLLARERTDAAFDPVRRYLAGGDVVTRFALARVLAETFDAYAAYRPRWLERWLETAVNHPPAHIARTAIPGRADISAHEAWQAALWNELAEPASPGGVRIPRTHPAETFFARLERDAKARARLPKRLSVFAPDALAPLYLDVLRRLGQYVDVTLYVVNPCRHYWGVIEQPGEVARAMERDPSSAEYRETGHPLLATLGHHAREFIDELNALPAELREHFDEPSDDEPSDDESLGDEPSGRSLLACVQRDVLDMVDRHGAERYALTPTDRSIEVHVCRGPMREAEVLHDQLLARFEADPTLQPEDVLVLCADLDGYASALDAVFASAPRSRHIPHGIVGGLGASRNSGTSGNNAGRGDGLGRSLVAIIDCALGRLDADSVVRLLDEPSVARRFAIPADELPRIRRWIAETGIRWGADESSRVALGLPETRAHSWAAGLDRLVIGGAVAPNSQTTIAGVWPYDDVEGSLTVLAGNLDRFFQVLVRLAEALKRPRAIGVWRERFASALDEFHAIDPTLIEGAQRIRQALSGLAEEAQLADFDEAVPARLAFALAREAIDASERSVGLGRAGVAIMQLASGVVTPAKFI